MAQRETPGNRTGRNSALTTRRETPRTSPPLFAPNAALISAQMAPFPARFETAPCDSCLPFLIYSFVLLPFLYFYFCFEDLHVSGGFTCFRTDFKEFVSKYILSVSKYRLFQNIDHLFQNIDSPFQNIDHHIFNRKDNVSTMSKTSPAKDRNMKTS